MHWLYNAAVLEVLLVELHHRGDLLPNDHPRNPLTPTNSVVVFNVDAIYFFFFLHNFCYCCYDCCGFDAISVVVASDAALVVAVAALFATFFSHFCVFAENFIFKSMRWLATSEQAQSSCMTCVASFFKIF